MHLPYGVLSTDDHEDIYAEKNIFGLRVPRSLEESLHLNFSIFSPMHSGFATQITTQTNFQGQRSQVQDREFKSGTLFLACPYKAFSPSREHAR